MKSHERSRDRYLDAGVRGDRGSRRHRCLCWPSANACLSMWNTCACPTLFDISNDQQKARDYLALPSTQLISQMNSTTAPAPLYIFYITIVHYAKRKHRISSCFYSHAVRRDFPSNSSNKLEIFSDTRKR